MLTTRRILERLRLALLLTHLPLWLLAVEASAQVLPGASNAPVYRTLTVRVVDPIHHKVLPRAPIQVQGVPGIFQTEADGQAIIQFEDVDPPVPRLVWLELDGYVPVSARIEVDSIPGFLGLWAMPRPAHSSPFIAASEGGTYEVSAQIFDDLPNMIFWTRVTIPAGALRADARIGITPLHYNNLDSSGDWDKTYYIGKPYPWTLAAFDVAFYGPAGPMQNPLHPGAQFTVEFSPWLIPASPDDDWTGFNGNWCNVYHKSTQTQAFDLTGLKPQFQEATDTHSLALSETGTIMVTFEDPLLPKPGSKELADLIAQGKAENPGPQEPEVTVQMQWRNICEVVCYSLTKCNTNNLPCKVKISKGTKYKLTEQEQKQIATQLGIKAGKLASYIAGGGFDVTGKVQWQTESEFEAWNTEDIGWDISEGEKDTIPGTAYSPSLRCLSGSHDYSIVFKQLWLVSSTGVEVGTSVAVPTSTCVKFDFWIDPGCHYQTENGWQDCAGVKIPGGIPSGTCPCVY